MSFPRLNRSLPLSPPSAPLFPSSTTGSWKISDRKQAIAQLTAEQTRQLADVLPSAQPIPSTLASLSTTLPFVHDWKLEDFRSEASHCAANSRTNPATRRCPSLGSTDPFHSRLPQHHSSLRPRLEAGRFQIGSKPLRS